MTRSELVQSWLARAQQFKRLSAMVDGHRLISEMITDLELLFREEESEILTLEEAAKWSGYSSDHLARSLRRGAIPNAGRKGQPRIRRGDLPRKPGALQQFESEDMFARRQIALSVVTSKKESNDG